MIQKKCFVKVKRKVVNKIKLSVWVKIGIFFIRRDSLPSNHPESEYQQLRSLGLKPEEFGIEYKPIEDYV